MHHALPSFRQGMCPDGQRYGVGDNNDNCKTLACDGGIQVGECVQRKDPRWAMKRVTCGKATTKAEAENAKAAQYFMPNKVTSGAAAKAGGYGGICTLTEKMNLHPLCSLYYVLLSSRVILY